LAATSYNDAGRIARPSDAGAIVNDGPFSEAKEVIGGRLAQFMNGLERAGLHDRLTRTFLTLAGEGDIPRIGH
jgi:hypothetical protein